MEEDEDKNFAMLPHYSGYPVGFNGEGLSCDQFCEIVECQMEISNWNEHDAFNYAVQAFTGTVSEI